LACARMALNAAFLYFLSLDFATLEPTLLLSLV
jgi:hypothetical protein